MATHNDAHPSGDHGDHAHHSVRDDRAPAFVGLIGGAILIFGVLFGVVHWTNSRFAGHAEGAKAETTK